MKKIMKKILKIFSSLLIPFNFLFCLTYIYLFKNTLIGFIKLLKSFIIFFRLTLDFYFIIFRSITRFKKFRFSPFLLIFSDLLPFILCLKNKIITLIRLITNWFTRLVKHFFTRKNFSFIIIIIISGFFSRHLVNIAFNANVFLDYFNPISLFYYLFFTIYSIILKANIHLFNFPVIPSFLTIKELTKNFFEQSQSSLRKKQLVIIILLRILLLVIMLMLLLLELI